MWDFWTLEANLMKPSLNNSLNVNYTLSSLLQRKSITEWTWISVEANQGRGRQSKVSVVLTEKQLLQQQSSKNIVLEIKLVLGCWRGGLGSKLTFIINIIMDYKNLIKT